MDISDKDIESLADIVRNSVKKKMDEIGISTEDYMYVKNLDKESYKNTVEKIEKMIEGTFGSEASIVTRHPLEGDIEGGLAKMYVTIGDKTAVFKVGPWSIEFGGKLFPFDAKGFIEFQRLLEHILCAKGFGVPGQTI